jgi:hypothetical protein
VNPLELVIAAWLAGMIVTYVTISAGISRDEENRFLKTRLWLALTWPVMLSCVAWWTASHTWGQLMDKIKKRG